jgi:glutamine synthetase
MIASVAAARSLLRRAPGAFGGVRSMASLSMYEDYGKHVFTGTVADTYLKKHGADASILKDPSWTKTHADVVANAVLDW